MTPSSASPGSRAPSAPHRYLAIDVLAHAERYDIVTWFRPFLDDFPLLQWGLPKRLLQPEALLEHVLARLDPGGTCVIFNQTEHEAELQHAMLQRAKHPFHSLTAPLNFSEKRRQGYVHVVDAR